MKLISYRSPGGHGHLGALRGDRIVNLHQASNGELPDDMLEFLHLGEPALERAALLLTGTSPALALDEVELLSPVPRPGKVVAIGLNYMDHIRESGLGVPQLATMFCKYSTSVIGGGEAIRWSTSLTRQVDFEAELAVVIGKSARNVAENDAYEYVAGYTNCNDVSARDLQFREGDQWLRGKCLDT